MSAEGEDRIYENVLREVIWGTERDEVFRLLHANGITGERAEQMFQRARHERVSLLRGEAARRAAKGVMLIAAGIALFCGFWYGLGWIMRPIIIGSGLLCAWGFWRAVSGTMDFLLAPNKRGSVSADD